MPEQTTSSDITFKAGCSPVCDVVRKPKRRKRRSRPLHRWLGALAAVPLVWVLVTGFILNHSEDFGLEDKRVSNSLVLNLYGMTPKWDPVLYQAGPVNLVHWDGVNFLNSTTIDLAAEPLGVAYANGQIIVASSESVSIFNQTGELLETLDELSLPSLPIIGIGTTRNGVAIKNGEAWWEGDRDWIEFSKVASAEMSVKSVSSVSEGDRKLLAAEWAGGGLPASRVVLDLHAGHFLGDFAKYFYDLVIVCTLWLIGTGLVLQYRTSRRNRAPRPAA